MIIEKNWLVVPGNIYTVSKPILLNRDSVQERKDKIEVQGWNVWKVVDFSAHSRSKNVVSALTLNIRILLKVVSATFLLICFVCLKETICETRKNVFFLLWKLFSFLRQSNFKFSDIQVSWYHQMPKHESRITFYRITWEVNTVW